MKKTTKKSQNATKRKVVAFGGMVLVFIVIGASFIVKQIRYYNEASDQASLVATRELILLAVKGVKKDAPVDPRTGDVYFPESKLYLPNPGTSLTITYFFDHDALANNQAALTVSTYPVRSTHALYSAKNHDDLFVAVPHLQACSRGIRIAYGKYPAEDNQLDLKHTVRLSDGRDVFIYMERACDELSDVADLLKSIKSY